MRRDRAQAARPGAPRSRLGAAGVSRRRGTVLLLAVALACAAPAPDSRTDTRAAGAPTPSAPGASWATVAWHPHQAPVADPGRGVVALAAAEGAAPGSSSAATPSIDTLVFRSRPDPSAPAAGLLLVRTDTIMTEGSWHHAVAAPALAAPNLVEFGYEESGVPIDSAADGGRWLRGLLGTDSAGRWLTGWADTRDARITHRWWAEHLAAQALFALDTARLRFATDPGGAPLAMPDGDFILYGADSVRGRWLLVHLLAPSDYCAAGDSVARREQRLWVQYLDARGRPRVWYHSRGC